MSILSNFRNPWEADRGVLESDVLDMGVLENDVLSESDNDYFPTSTLSGVNPTSAKRLLKEIQDTFKGTEAEKLVNLWFIGTDGVTIESGLFLSNYINNIKDFDTRILLKAYFHAMMDKRVHIIEMITRKEFLSKYGEKQLELTNYKKQEFKYKTGKNVDEEDGGGKSVIANWDEEKAYLWQKAEEGAYCVVVMNSTSNVKQYSDGILRPSLQGEILAHELLGHGIGRYYNTFQNVGIDESIQMGNLYLRIKKKSYYRMHHGSAHSENFNPNGVPLFYMFPS